MKKQPKKKLALSQETLQQLTLGKDDLKAAAGGTFATVCLTEFCNSDSLCHC